MAGRTPKPRAKAPARPSLRTGPDIEPNLWMWVDPNIVFPPGRLQVRQPGKGEALTSPSRQQPPKEEDLAHCSEAKTAGPLPPSSGEPSPPPKRFAPPPGTWEVGVLGCGQGGNGMMHQRVLFSRDDTGLTGSEISCSLGLGRRPGGPRHCPPHPWSRGLGVRTSSYSAPVAPRRGGGSGQG